MINKPDRKKIIIINNTYYVHLQVFLIGIQL